MTGGLAWIYDEDGEFLGKGRYHDAFLQPDTWDELETPHANRFANWSHCTRKTASTRAQWLLSNWNTEAQKFVRLTPKPQA